MDDYSSGWYHYTIMGVVIRSLDYATRTKIRNPNYEYVRRLRGNQPNLFYRFLELRKEDLVFEYLNYFHEDKPSFEKYNEILYKFTIELYKCYVSCYIKKEKPLLEYPSHFRTHMYMLHSMYINELKAKNENIKLKHVIQFVNHLHPSLQMDSMNKL
jgi:hypothetical protein